jgi:hypothetical protein
MNWIDLLKDEQREFIQNDEKIFTCKELIYLSNKPLLKQIEETSIKVANRENRAYAKAANDDAIKAIKLFEEIEWFGAANTARFQIDINLDF